MAVQVDTNDYQFAHGKRPAGDGHWAFFFARHAPVEQAFWHAGKYSVARAAAVAEAKRRGFETVYVGS